ncbi:HHIP protein 1-like [Tropilaelaps mercedesae]|uniref:HHIP protein 1-like n=1 Tax=Tropilaelaps mercedesae TaxID=418985 RepID=A0A1V9XXP1_9ACAR|nr:HHIP protein 1-like [Tropilaelaps mercedesae]
MDGPSRPFVPSSHSAKVQMPFRTSAVSKSNERISGAPSETLLISSSRKSFEGADHDTVVTAIPFGPQQFTAIEAKVSNINILPERELLIDEEYELTRVPQPSSRYNGGQLLSRVRLSAGMDVPSRHDTVERIVYLTTGDGAMKNNESTQFNETISTRKILRMTINLGDNFG